MRLKVRTVPWSGLAESPGVKPVTRTLVLKGPGRLAHESQAKDKVVNARPRRRSLIREYRSLRANIRAHTGTAVVGGPRKHIRLERAVALSPTILSPECCETEPMRKRALVLRKVRFA